MSQTLKKIAMLAAKKAAQETYKSIMRLAGDDACRGGEF